VLAAAASGVELATFIYFFLSFRTPPVACERADGMCWRPRRAVWSLLLLRTFFSLSAPSFTTARHLRARRWNVLAAAASGVELQMLPLLGGFFTYKLAVIGRWAAGELAAWRAPAAARGGGARRRRGGARCGAGARRRLERGRRVRRAERGPRIQ